MAKEILLYFRDGSVTLSDIMKEMNLRKHQHVVIALDVCLTNPNNAMMEYSLECEKFRIISAVPMVHCIVFVVVDTEGESTS